MYGINVYGAVRNGVRGVQKTWLRALMVLMLVFCAVNFQARAQVNAQLVGVVTDPSGAVVPGVMVKVMSLTSNQEYHASTDAQGRYSFLTLPAGSYRISATKKSFKTLERTAELTVDQAANLNLVMEIGNVNQVVQVSSADAPLVNATNSTVGTVVEQKEIANLPLNGRNFATLITLTPGVSPTDVSQNGAGPSVQGQRNRDNSYQADGASIGAMSTGVIAMTPPLDSVEEFRVQSVNGDAEFGSASGGFVNLITKSGTNRFRGSVYDYLRNNDLDARDTFQKTLPAYKQNQYGFSLGGPVLIPKILTVSNTKTYFFLNYEALRYVQNGSGLGIVPTDQQLLGNFAGFNPVYDPFTTAPDPAHPGMYTRTQFAQNNISSEINPQALAYAKAYFPRPNYSVAGSPDNFINTAPSVIRTDTWMGRLDHTVNSWNRVSFRWLQSNSFSGSTLAVGNNLQNGSYAKPRNISIEWNSTLSPTTLVTIRYGYDRSNVVSQTPLQSDFFNSDGFNNPDGFPPSTPSQPLIPAMSITGYSTYLPAGYSPTIVDSNTGTADIQKIWGKHSFKAGGSWNHEFTDNGGINPTESFGVNQTQNLESPTGTGDAMASFLIGVPTTAGRTIGLPILDIYGNFYGFYAQDTIKLTKTLSVSAGLRWDHAARFATSGTLGSFDQQTGNTWLLTGPVSIPGAAFNGPNIGPGILAPKYTDFGPRIGFAYQLRPRLVVRGGYGLFFDTVAGRWQWIQGPRVVWPVSLFEQTPALNTSTVQVNISNPFVGQPSSVYITNPFYNTNGTPAYPAGSNLNPNYTTPRVNEYNLAFEQQITDKLVASVTYVGSIGKKLECCGLNNFAYTNGPTTYNIAPRPFPMMGVFRTDNNYGHSSYNGLEFKVQQNLTRGLSFLSSYTYSKSTDLGCSGYIGAEGCQLTQPYNLKVDHGLSAFDLRNVANFSVVYELPFGKGRMFSTHSRALDLIAGGWQASGIFTIHSGTPLTPLESNSTQTNIGVGVAPRPNLVAAPAFKQSRNEFFNTAAFQNPSGYSYGTAGRNILHGPMQHSENISLFKDFEVVEVHGSPVKLEYRADMFNAFNLTTYGNPGLTLGTSTFGIISTANPGRIIQMAVKVIF